jgi:cystathionine beta-lyase
MKEDTKIVTAGRNPKAYGGAVNPPVYHASTVLFPTVAELENRYQPGPRRMQYGRRGTPTTWALEDALAALEGGAGCTLYPSGLGAITGALLSFLKAGDHLLMVDTTYMPTRILCDGLLKRFGVETTFYDPALGADVAKLMRPNTRVVYCESPGSLTFEVQDIPATAAAAKAKGAITMIDNTWASPLFFKPLAHGIDVSIHAGTKYIVGHSDAMLGACIANEKALPELKKGWTEMGLCAGPDDVYLAQRGVRTLGVRMRQHHANGLALATWLKTRPEVARVLHPALPDDPGHKLWKRDFTGASGLFGLILKPVRSEAIAAMLDGLEHYGMGFSWGGFESLMIPSHPEKSRSATRWQPEGPTLRIHAGLEDVEDLKADLDAGFARLKKAS